MAHLQALIFDVDGTLADTEGAHLAAFNQAFASADLPWRWDESLYISLLEVSGGKERMAHYLAHHLKRHPGHDSLPAAGGSPAMSPDFDALHAIKTTAYTQQMRAGALALRPGIEAIIATAQEAGLRLAIATTTTESNIDALLRPRLGADWSQRFEVIEHAGTAPRKKPDPQVYRQTLQRLGLAATACLAIEDSANGLQAALGAGIATIITPNPFTAHHNFKGALRILPSLESTAIADLHRWHADATR
jgi:HAD superfamily hydrolase (TIGR01509 family)